MKRKQVKDADKQTAVWVTDGPGVQLEGPSEIWWTKYLPTFFLFLNIRPLGWRWNRQLSNFGPRSVLHSSIRVIREGICRKIPAPIRHLEDAIVI